MALTHNLHMTQAHNLHVTQAHNLHVTQAHNRMKHFTLISINWQLPIWPVNQISNTSCGARSMHYLNSYYNF